MAHFKELYVGLQNEAQILKRLEPCVVFISEEIALAYYHEFSHFGSILKSVLADVFP